MTTLAAKPDILTSIRSVHGEKVEAKVKEIVGDKEITEYWIDEVLGQRAIYFRYDGKTEFVRL